MSSTYSSNAHRLERSVVHHRDRAETLAVVSLASLVAARLEPALRGYWICCAVIAVVMAAGFGAAGIAARQRLEVEFDRLLASGAEPAHDPLLDRYAERISSPRHARRQGRRLLALIDQGLHHEHLALFQAGLVVRHGERLVQIAETLTAAAAPPVSATARVRLLLHSPTSPLLARDEDDARFSAWLRQIERDLTTASEPIPADRDSRPAGMWAPHLAATPLLGRLGADGPAFCESGRLVSFAAGETILDMGADGDTCYVIVEGTTRVEDDARVRTELGVGDVFGEIAALAHNRPYRVRRTATVTAATPVRAIEISGSQLQAAAETHPAVETYLRQLVSERLTPDALRRHAAKGSPTSPW